MENTDKLTLEQALFNLQLIIDKFIGTKQEHIALEQSLELVKSKIHYPPVIENITSIKNLYPTQKEINSELNVENK